MRHLLHYTLFALVVLPLLTACHNDEPTPIKPPEDRTILLLTGDGHIYNQTGKKITELPNCEYASEIISDGEDYFVSGKYTKDRVGYWKNGKWNTLHVDFIDDVEHETQGIGKYDYYIFLLDFPNILRNSGIFPLQDCENFTPPGKCISVSEGKCYVVGYDYNKDDGGFNDAILYYEKKGKYEKEILPKGRDDIDAAAFAVYAYDVTHTIVGGRVGTEPALWIDKQLQILPRTYKISENPYDPSFGLAFIQSLARAGSHNYAAGFEYNDDMKQVATVWIDGVPHHLTSGDEGLDWSEVVELNSYADDWYALSIELVRQGNPEDNNFDVNILIWMNGTIISRYKNIDVVNFTVF